MEEQASVQGDGITVLQLLPPLALYVTERVATLQRCEQECRKDAARHVRTGDKAMAEFDRASAERYRLRSEELLNLVRICPGYVEEQ